MMRICVVVLLGIAVFVPSGIAGDCSGDPGFVLSVPSAAGIGEFFDMCLNAHPDYLVILMASCGQGAWTSSYGTVCLDFPPLVMFTFVMPAAGGRCFHRYLPCDHSVVGQVGYMQFLALSVAGTTSGISNQSSIVAIDNGLCP